MSHDLVIIYKGFRQQLDLNEARSAFQGIEHLAIELPDVGFDIGAYFESAKRVSNRYLIFLNTHSEIAANEWLAALSRYGLAEGVGVAAAMGSYESLQDTVKVLKGVICRCVGVGRRYDPRTAYYFDFLLRRLHGAWYSSTGEVIRPRQNDLGPLGKLAVAATRLVYYPWLELRGTALIWPGAPQFDVRQFPRFPNAHVRSNGFMVRRDRWLQLEFSPSRKVDTSLFESGANSFTAGLREQGLATVVVGRDGTGYDIADWPRSRTFRLGDQGNLLIHDNHTRAFEAMSRGARITHAWMTWGDSGDPLPADFPAMDVDLQVNSLPPELPRDSRRHKEPS